jgi:iron complex transport system substrate-binding protein
MTATMVFGMTACGGTDSVSESDTLSSEVSSSESELSEATSSEIASSESVASENTSEQAAEETVYPIDITDSYGDVITLEYEPERVVSVAPNLTELMYELGASDKLVGRSDYCDYPEEVLEIESVGSLYTPDIEKIVSLEPDVVIVSTHFDEENTKKLEELNIPVITLYEENDVTGVYDMITTLGTAMNKNAEAAKCVEEMQETIKEVVDAVEEVERPSVYYVVGFGEYGDYTAGGDTFIGGLIELAGGDNIAKDVSGWSITLEEIVEADPSIIVISEDMKDSFMSDENYAELTAVKEGNVYTIDTNLLDRQGYRNAEGVRALAEIFHPEVFK